MKRILSLVLILGLAAGFAYGQSLDGFKSAFETFAGEMASSLALNAATGSNWSDAYVGGFPHFGVGLSAGAALTGKGSAEPVFAALGQAVPQGLDQYGIPVPAAAASFKIGLPFIPVDIGLSGGYIPPTVGSKLEGLTGVSVDYKNIGAQVRVGVLKEKLLLPDISLGFGGSYQQGSVKAPMGAGSQTLVDQNIGTVPVHWIVTASDPSIDLGWESTIFDATVQVSKTILFIRPYAGAGYSFGKSMVRGGVASDLTFTRDGIASDYGILAGEITAAGGTAPALSATGYSYTAESIDPVFRVYGGVSLTLLLTLDAQVVYVPATGALGASLSTRIQL
jgi:hypothetical protein